jgi:hypothetical protein
LARIAEETNMKAKLPHVALLTALVLSAGCSKASFKHATVTPRTVDGISGQPMQAVTAGGSVTEQKQTSIGVTSKGGVFTSPHFRAMIGVQGALYNK